MRKAHEAELQKERGKFLDMLAKTYSTADVDSIQRQHEYVYGEGGGWRNIVWIFVR